MTVHHPLKIWRPGTGPARPAAPVSNPAGYFFEFGGNAARMHKLGHIWLNDRNPPTSASLTLQLEIDPTSQFIFRNSGTSDGSRALFISLDPASKTTFFGSNGAFTNPTLDSTYTQLAVTAVNTGGLFYYYQLNVIDQANGNRLVTWDPIVICQP